jgi:hypothetical protein
MSVSPEAGPEASTGRRIILLATFLLATLPFALAQSVMTHFTLTGNGGADAVNRDDFNRDGNLDIIVGTNCGNNSTCRGVTVFLGSPSGVVANGVSSGPAGLPASDIAVGDFNRDGKLDVAFTGYLNGGNSGAIQILLGKGDGTFSNGQQIDNSGYPLASITTSDFNNDGNMDLAVQSAANQIALFQGAGDGTFTNVGSIALPATSRIVKVRVGDFDRDGKPDIAVLTASDLYVAWGEGNLAFNTAHIANYPFFVSDMTPTDVNQDGYTDILISYSTCTLDSPKSSTGCGAWSVLQSAANTRSFRQIATTTSASRFSTYGMLLAADINGDGVNDVIALSGFGATAWFGNPDGTYQSKTFSFVLGSQGASGLVAGDFNRDGKIDLAAAGAGSSSEGVAVVLNSTTQAPCRLSTESPAVTVCQPGNFTYSRSPVQLIAGATDATHITAMQAYVDGKLSYQTSGAMLHAPLALSLGSHYIVTKAWDAAGKSFWSPRQIAVFSGPSGETCSSSPLSLNICSPADNATTSNSVHLFAAAQSDAIVTAVQVYLDNNLIYNDKSESTYVDTAFTVSPGSHFFVVKVWDANGRVFQGSRMVTAQ